MNRLSKNIPPNRDNEKMVRYKYLSNENDVNYNLTNLYAGQLFEVIYRKIILFNIANN